MTGYALVNPQLDGKAFFFEGGRTGVMLAHGLTATAWEVRLLAQRLHAAGYSVIGPLLPGHGATPQELNRSTWQEWLAAAERAYQQVAARCQPVFVGGESMGGVLALYLASLHPEIAGVLTYAPAIKLNLSPFDALLLRLMAPFRLGVPKGGIDREEHWQGYPVNPLKAALQLLRLQDELRHRLSKIHQPVLVVQGRLDTTVHPGAGQLILEGVSSQVTEHHWMEKSSHVVLLDQELEAVTALTLDFMQRALAK